MEQAYIHFKQSIFQGKINKRTGELEGEEKLSNIGHSVEAYFPMPSNVLPPSALAYFDLVEEKGFIGQGNPILYVTSNDIQELSKEGINETYNLLAEWPAFHGNLQRRIDNRGYVCLNLCYFTKPVNYHDFEAFKEGCRIKDMTLKSTYNTLDLFKIIKNAGWNATIDLFVKRMSHDSALPIKFFEAINNGHKFFKDLVPDPQKRTPLCETASISYTFDDNLALADSKASGNLHPSWMYGGLSSPDMFDESKAPNRKPRAWTILTEKDALRSESGIDGYDNVIGSYFKNNMPLKEDIKGKSLELVIKEVMPQAIDSLIDFVEN